MINPRNTKIIITPSKFSIRLDDGSVTTPKLIRKSTDKHYRVKLDLNTENDNLSQEEINDAFEEFLDMKDIGEKFHLFLEARFKGTELSCGVTHFDLLDISEINE